MNITAKELSGLHLGQTVTVPELGTLGKLGDITHARGGGVKLTIERPDGFNRAFYTNPNTPNTIQEGECIGQSGNTGAFAREPIQETILKKIERNTQEGQ